MTLVERDITQEEYDRYSKMEKVDFYREIEKTISASWRFGYGWYGCKLYKDEETGRCYIVHQIGSSCD